ncbi:Gfo/Idh/MocA family protein [Streptomyces sp. NBC_01304]|uniref:Gfo/Idh/MocA family protein n=1 Tax=Streptomyces sp. NBC_01304 TaxID=2903818 RepID=UPI002E0ED960|nr:Gfo/Idh/MocA family oxidoreductase [Streptomyces sp. NBC_01304]
MTARVLLVGAGEVGAKHLHALGQIEGAQVAGIADPAPSTIVAAGWRRFDDWQTALAALRPHLVTVATPPGTALKIARTAAATGAYVLVEKPAALDAAQLAPQPGDERVFVGFQPHFAPGLAELLHKPPVVEHAEVTLVCRRDRPYYRGWRTQYATAGGVLHQQAIHGLALAVRLMNTSAISACTAARTHTRDWAETEDRIDADVRFETGATLKVRARVDSDAPPHHHVILHLADGQRLVVRGRNLEAGLGPEAAAPDHQILRQHMYRALLAATEQPAMPHPCLYPLSALRRLLEVITHVYDSARPVPAAA